MVQQILSLPEQSFPTAWLDNRMLYIPKFLSAEEADLLFQELSTSIQWREETIRMFGKWVLQPRLTAWYGDEGVTYSYSGRKMEPEKWTPALELLKKKVELQLKTPFNSVLLNFYRNGKDSMGWHRDNEPELGKNPIIASLSLGAERIFKVRTYDKSQPKQEVKILLGHGSLLVMQKDMQSLFEHELPKSAKVQHARINLTFRQIGRGDKFQSATPK